MTPRRLPPIAALALAATTLLGIGSGAPTTTTSGWSAPHEVVLGNAAPTAGASYRFSSTLDGKPVRWDPCTAIHWQFSAGGGPRGGLEVVASAVARVAAVTGTHWEYDGAVGTAPGSSWLPGSPAGARPVLIGWSDAAHSDLLRGRPSQVLGVTRTAWFGTDDHQGHRLAALRAAVVVLDRTDPLPLTGRASWKAVALHELGHVMDLDHVSDGRQLMAPVLPRGLSDYSAGDLAGLRRLGRSAGCVSVPGV